VASELLEFGTFW